MATYLTWEKTVRQVAIAGKVIDPYSSLPVAGAAVSIRSMPAAFSKWLSLRSLSYGARWSALSERPDRTSTSRDGFFRFIDLPDGAYTVEIAPPDDGRRFDKVEKGFTVARDAKGNINLVIALIALPATAVRGTILGASASDEGAADTALPMARVEVVGTLERAYGDAAGKFYLTDVEPGKRQIEITASGYQAATATVTVVKGAITEMGSFVLVPLASSV